MDEKRKETERSPQGDRSIDERVHQQLVYKDNRIIDLNNVILDKERQILDLQERVREHNEVASVKNQAMRIVQQKFEEIEGKNRDKKDMSTETEPALLSHGPSTSAHKNIERRTRSSSPGHVIAARKNIPTSSSGTFSPPPLDPPFESKLGALPDIDGIHRKHHQRKRVTFDLNPNSSSTSSSFSRHHHTSTSTSDALESALTEASSENALLRQQVIDLNAAVELMKSEYESEIVKYTKEAKTAGLKAKVAATARIKELESSLEDVNGRLQDENERLVEEVETLRSSRNWEIEQNAQLRDQVAHLKEKAHKLTEELDASEKAKRSLDSEVEESKKLMSMMVEDLQQAEVAINYHVNQKVAIFEDIDRLKEAIVAQDRFIEILEADIVIYEQHIGLLRENLGASQIDHRALIKSKAFETKLLALEREKEKSDKKSNEDRLKTKALDKKCRVLVEQNEQLMARLCELEMSSASGATTSESGRIAEQDEQIRQVTSALESERDVSQRLREAKEALERELIAKRKQEESMNNRRQMDVEMSRMEAQNRIDEMTVEVEAAHKKVADVMAELEQLRATNFDLQMHIETAKRTLEELADSNELLEKQIEQAEEALEEKEEDMKQSTWDVETLTRQNEALRVELDGVRQGCRETRELADEVKLLKAELARQQEAHRAQFEADCEQLEQEDAPNRKTSLEVQQEQYILAYEEQVKSLNETIEQLKSELQNAPAPRKTTALLEPPTLEQLEQIERIQEVQLAQAPEQDSVLHLQEVMLHEQLKNEVEGLKRKNQEIAEKMKRLEMEAKLSGELNVELGRAMLELEEHNDLLRKEQQTVTADEVATGRELELHVMMVQEMTEQIQSMQKRIDEMEQHKEHNSRETEKWRVEASSARHENQRVNSELERLLHNLAESEIARREELERAAAEHDAEIRVLSIQMEDSRRDIADLEEKLREAVEKLRAPMAPMAPVAPMAPMAQVTLQEAPILTASTPEVPDDELREQNKLLRECHDDVSRDMSKLIELKDELEIAVQALKAEIWSLNGQLKASILDREGLEDKVAELDDLVEKEKKRALALDVELQEQVDLTDRAVRRAAEAENESNQRMAECLEKETRREEMEKAYTRLNEYYNQLQEAYNNVYAQLAGAQGASSVPEPETEPLLDSIMTILLISKDGAISLSTQGKLEKVAQKLKALMEEYTENQTALEEQRRISEALEQRLGALESSSDEVTTTRERVEQLEGEIEWKEEECEGLKRRIRELEKALEAVAERADESEAARLTTRQADVDSLFRTNAELAHTNVRLQNEVDEMEELRSKMHQEKQQLEEHVKELEEQVAELMEQHEAHLQQIPLESSSDDSQKEIQRLSAIEKTLNTRILALEDQNLELEEKVQEIEDEMMDLKKESKKEEQWDSWGEPEPKEELKELEEAKNEVLRLEEVEKSLKMRVEMLEMHNEQLESRISTKKPEEKLEKAQDDWGWGDEEKEEETTDSPNQDEDWGWGEEEKKETAPNEELLQAKWEIDRLTQIEIVLNNRISALEDQNLELEERLQEMEEGLKEEKERKTDNSDHQKSVSELQERLKFQKEVIEKVEAELIEQQDRYDELQETVEKMQGSENLSDELENLKIQLESALEERKSLQSQLDQSSEEKQRLEEKIQELEQENQQKDAQNDGWNDDGWGNEEEKGDNEELLKLQAAHQELTEQLEQLTLENRQQRKEGDEMAEKITLIESQKLKVEEQLRRALEELQELKEKLEEAESAQDQKDGWNDEEWADNSEIDKLKEAQKVLELKVGALQEELFRVKEHEQELIESNCSLQSRLEAVQNELESTQQKLNEAEASSGWNDDGWNEQEEDEVKKALETELAKRNETIEKLQEQVTHLRKQLLEVSESADLRALEELEHLKEQLRVTSEQNGLLKDSEARLLDHADEFAVQMEQYKEKCSELAAKIKELEAQLEQVQKKELKVSSDELVTLRQKLANAEQENRTKNATISDREGLISELRRQIAEQTKTVEELAQKLRTLARRAAPPRASMSSNSGHPQSSRPSSRLSTSSSYVPEAVSVPLQSTGSAFDVVVPQGSEPLRRRNK